MQFRKGRIDPLELLRDSIIQKKEIKLKQKNSEYRLQFENNVELKINTETAWKSKSNREYNLGALWWFLECQQKNIENKEYRSKAFDKGIDFVGRADQQEIIEYFTGKIEYTECINAEKKTLLYKKHDNKKEEEGEQGSQKKVKVDAEKEPLSEKDFNLKVLDEILRFEKPITTRNRLFRVPDRSFDNLLKVATRILSGQYMTVDSVEQGDTMKSNQISKSVIQYSLLNEFLKTKEKAIIIVPQIHEIGNICLKNSLQLLEGGEYVDPSTVKFTNESRQITFRKRLPMSDIELPFQIVDTPTSISNWKRVVAIFLRGSNYELKLFQEQDPLVLFKNVRGYHLKFEEEKLKDSIKAWNVLVQNNIIKILSLHRNKRHQDKAVVAQFWEDLEKFLLRPENNSNSSNNNNNNNNNNNK